MRLWSLDPAHLDTKGLVALWREGLLAQAVVEGGKGYSNHAQLVRFKDTDAPREYLSCYLLSVYNEATRRGFKFDRTKILPFDWERIRQIPVTQGQLGFELEHLKRKLELRDPDRLAGCVEIAVHPLFKVISGPIEGWEKV